jgi:hypothetical protein
VRLDGVSQVRTPQTTRRLFAAVHDDALDAFVVAHPGWVYGTATP